jgi:putative DNA primase/helicase
VKGQKEDLKPPNIIINATHEYRCEIGVIGNFIKERCEEKPGLEIRAGELFKCYQDWCEEHNKHAMSEQFLGLWLKELGFEQQRSNDGRYWQNIGVRPDF